MPDDYVVVAMSQPSAVLTAPERDTIENYARAAVEEWPEDTVPRLVLRLLAENAELRSLLGHDARSVPLVAQLAEQVERLDTALQLSRSDRDAQLLVNAKLKESEWRLAKENRNLSERVRKLDVVLGQLVVLIEQSRKSLQAGPTSFASLAPPLTDEYDAAKEP